MFARGTIILMIAALAALLACSKEKETSSAERPGQFKDLGESSGIDSSLAGGYFSQAEQFAKAARYDSAIVHYETAGKIYRQEKQWEKYVRSLSAIGVCLTEKADYARGRQILEEAIEIGSRQLGERHLELSRCYNNLGTLHWRQGSFDEALVFHDQALSLQTAALGRDHPEVANSYLAIGNVFQFKGDHDRALSFKEKALAIRLTALGDRHAQVAEVYNSMAIDYAEKSDYDKALEFFLKASSIWRASLGENHPRISFSYHNVGVVYALKGDNKQSIANMQKSLSIKLGTLGEKHLSTIQSYHAIGLAHAYDGDYQQAMRIYEKAVPLAEEVLGANHPELANGYNNLGIIHRLMGRPERALDFYQRGLSIRHKIYGAKHPANAETYNDVGLIYLDKGNYDRALEAVQAAINANISGFSYGDPYLNPPLLNILSESELLKSLSRKAQIFAARYGKGSGEIRDLQAGVFTFDHAVRLLENMRSGYKAEGSKLNLAQNALAVYEKAIQTTLRLFGATQERQHREKAFSYAEKSKAGILLEELSEAEAKQFANLPDSLLEKERQLRIDLAYYDRMITDEHLKGAAADSSKLGLWQDKKFDLERDYEALLRRFETEYRDYYNLKYQIRTASVQEVQEELLDENTALVEYFTGADSIFIFTMTHKNFSVAAVAKDSSFERQVGQMRRGIIEKKFQQYAQAAHRLHRTLLEPVAGHLNVEHLIIIPDGVLSTIPFEALLTQAVRAEEQAGDYSQLPYLVKDHKIHYAYSSTLLLQMLGRAKPQPARDYLAFAPVFPQGMPAGTRGEEFFKMRAVSDSAPPAAQLAGFLPASKKEVNEVFKVFERSYGFFERLFGRKSRVYLESEANEANLKSPASSAYRYLHFATHGFVNEANPKLSGLVLAQDNNAGEDGILHLGEIYSLNLNAELVVLSACETGLGQIAKGGGIIGLTRGFLYAGASNLLVSLWQVNDETTAELMVDFYGSMLKGQTKAEALRQAKLKLIQSHPEYAKPYYWAPFILVGR